MQLPETIPLELHTATVKAAMNRLHHANSKTSHGVNHSGIARSIAHLWKNSELCDCTLVSSQQDRFPAHKVVLAAASQYFKVLFLGAGQHMMSSMPKGDQGTHIASLNVHVDSNSLELVLQAIYHEEFVVSWKSVMCTAVDMHVQLEILDAILSR